MTFFNILTKNMYTYTYLGSTYAFKASTQIIYLFKYSFYLHSYSSQMSMTFFGDSHTAVLAFCFFRVSTLQVVLGYLNLNYYNLKPKRTFLLFSPHNTRMLIFKDWDFFLNLSGTFSGPNHSNNPWTTCIIPS